VPLKDDVGRGGEEQIVSIARGYLLVIGLLLVAFGLAYLIAPAPMAALAGLELPSPLAFIEVRGFYGGQLVGLGGFVLLGVSKPPFVVPGLLLTAFSLGGTAFGRIAGVLAAGSLPPMILAALVLEITGSGVAVLLLIRERGVGAPASR
jgi:hypothetical protein